MGRRVDSGVAVSLFPFLSILACLIGCLIVIIVALTVTQLNKAEGREPEEVERARAYLIMQEQQEEEAQEIKELQQRIDDVIQNRQELMKMREKLQLLKADAESQKKLDAIRDELIAQLNLLKKQNSDLVASYEKLLAEIEELKKQMADRQKPPEAPPVQVRPGGSSRNTRPYFVEVAGETIIIHRKDEEPVQIPTANLQTSKEFIDLLKTVEAKPYRTLIFLIRGNPQSIENWRKANSIVNQYAANASRSFRAAKLPIPGEGKIDLSVFEEFME